MIVKMGVATLEKDQLFFFVTAMQDEFMNLLFWKQSLLFPPL